MPQGDCAAQLEGGGVLKVNPVGKLEYDTLDAAAGPAFVKSHCQLAACGVVVGVLPWQLEN